MRGSMFPPETMQTTLPVPARPASAAAVASAPAPSAITRTRSAIRRIAAAALVERDGEGAVDQRSGVLPDAGDQRAAAGAVDERAHVVDLDRSAGRERRRHGRAGLGLDGIEAHVGSLRLDGARDPGEQAAAAVRHDHRVEIGQVLEQLEPDRAVARHHRAGCRRDG